MLCKYNSRVQLCMSCTSLRARRWLRAACVVFKRQGCANLILESRLCMLTTSAGYPNFISWEQADMCKRQSSLCKGYPNFLQSRLCVLYITCTSVRLGCASYVGFRGKYKRRLSKFYSWEQAVRVRHVQAAE